MRGKTPNARSFRKLLDYQNGFRQKKAQENTNDFLGFVRLCLLCLFVATSDHEFNTRNFDEHAKPSTRP